MYVTYVDAISISINAIGILTFVHFDALIYYRFEEATISNINSVKLVYIGGKP